MYDGQSRALEEKEKREQGEDKESMGLNSLTRHPLPQNSRLPKKSWLKSNSGNQAQAPDVSEPAKKQPVDSEEGLKRFSSRLRPSKVALAEMQLLPISPTHRSALVGTRH